MLISLDLETVCDVPGCPGHGLADNNKCKHALHHLRNRVTVIGMYWEVGSNDRRAVFRNLADFEYFINSLDNFELVGQNLKFDLKTLSTKINRSTYQKLLGAWKHDTICMAVASSKKVSPQWLEEYEEKRKEINKATGSKHREAGGYSLKTMAPFFLGVEPFWEVDDKDDDTYVLQDCKYAYDLCQYFLEFLKVDGTLSFYESKLMPWNKLLLNMELAGIAIDLEALEQYEKEVTAEYELKSKQLLEVWKDGIEAYNKLQRQNTLIEFRDKLPLVIEKTRSTKLWAKLSNEKKDLKLDEVIRKQLNLLETKLAKIEPFNMNSDDQMLWLLKDHYGYDCRGEPKKNPKTGEIEVKFSTGKDVKERLIIEGKEDIILFDEVGKLNKLITSFFASYREAQVDGVIYCSFKIQGTRTGRLASEDPNLQQVPTKMKRMFRARPGYKFICKDAESIEPKLIGYFSECPTLCGIFMQGENFHGVATQSMVEYVTCPSKEVKKLYPKERNMVKQVDLSIFYGTGKNGIVRTAKKHRFNWTVEESVQKLRAFKKKFNGVFKFKEELDAKLVNGSILNVLGRKISYEDPTEIYMKGFNGLVQGSASDLITHAAAKTDAELRARRWGRVLILEHDAIVIEAKAEFAEKAAKLYDDILGSFKLETVHGTMTLTTEGFIDEKWEH